MKASAKQCPACGGSWAVKAFETAKERADLGIDLFECEVWLSNGKTIFDVETIEQDGLVVSIGTITGAVYVREQDVVAIVTP